MAAYLGRNVRRCLDCTRHYDDDGDGIYSNRRPSCLSSPFVGYYIVVFFLNGVAIAAGIVSQMDFHYYSGDSYQSQRLDSWYVTNAIFGVIHVLAALYMVHKIQEPSQLPIVMPTTLATVTVTHHATAAAPSAPPDYHLYTDNENTNKSSGHYNASGSATVTTAARAPVKNKFAKWVLRDKRKDGKSYTEPTQVAIAVPIISTATTATTTTTTTPYYNMAHPTPMQLPSPVVASQMQQQSRSVGNRNNHPNSSNNNNNNNNNKGPWTEPESWARIKTVLCESLVVALYICICLIYLAWHYFVLDNFYYGMYHRGMWLVEKCGDVFVCAGPASFAFSIAICLCRRREL